MDRKADGRRGAHLLAAFYSTPWAVLPAKLAEIETMLRHYSEFGARGASDWECTLRASAHAAAARASRAQGTAVAVLPVFGMISRRAGMFSDFFGGTSIESLTRSFRAALADPAVKAIVFDVDSPGGTAAGVPELASEILAARSAKQILAVADGLCASAAYWLASAADILYAVPSSEGVGSIGVFAVHTDLSKMLEADGVAVSLISSGQYKTEGNPYQPLGSDARAFLQKRVNEYGEMFTGNVAAQRGVSPKAVRETFGQGRAFGAAEAKSRGMVDRIGTLDDLLSKLGVAQGAPSRSVAGFGIGGTHNFGLRGAALLADIDSRDPVARAREELDEIRREDEHRAHIESLDARVRRLNAGALQSRLRAIEIARSR